MKTLVKYIDESLIKSYDTEKLKKAGFEVSSVEVYNDGGHAENTVKSSYGMAPKAGTTCAIGEEIILQVYGKTVTTTEPSTADTDE